MMEAIKQRRGLDPKIEAGYGRTDEEVKTDIDPRLVELMMEFFNYGKGGSQTGGV